MPPRGAVWWWRRAAPLRRAQVARVLLAHGADDCEVPVTLAKAAREAQKMRSASALLNDWKLSPQDLSYGVLHIDTQHPVYELHALPESLPCSVRR